MYGYIYETTNICNNKKYIGKHKSSKFDKQYKGSGKTLKNAFKKHGKSNFVVRIIDECDSLQELDEKEVFWIKFYNAVNNPNYYNILSGGEGGATFTGKHHTDETKRKLAEKSKNHRLNKEQIEKIRESNRKRVISEETRQKLSQKRKEYWDKVGRKHTVLTPEEKRLKLETANQRRSLTMKGHPVSQETRNKISQKLKGKPTWNKGIKINLFP